MLNKEKSCNPRKVTSDTPITPKSIGADIQTTLLRWGKWSRWSAGQEVGFAPSPLLRFVPRDADDLAPLSDTEAESVNLAYRALQIADEQQGMDRARVLFAAYVQGMSDADISRRLRVGGRQAVVAKRHKAENYMAGALDILGFKT